MSWWMGRVSREPLGFSLCGRCSSHLKLKPCPHLLRGAQFPFSTRVAYTHMVHTAVCGPITFCPLPSGPITFCPLPSGCGTTVLDIPTKVTARSEIQKLQIFLWVLYSVLTCSKFQSFMWQESCKIIAWTDPYYSNFRSVCWKSWFFPRRLSQPLAESYIVSI